MKPTAEIKPISPIRHRLMLAWLLWLVYRWFGVAVLVHSWVPQADIVGGIVWQGVWLIPALISTPFILKGKNPYALLVISMLTLVYLGGSGMRVLTFGFTQAWHITAVWVTDFGLLAWINYWLFILLKRLPKLVSAT